jgi:AraC family transcriptional regulator, regulatory protein of adaptative response / methylated-DNA-[protein]-cysteine methyltransferase
MYVQEIRCPKSECEVKRGVPRVRHMNELNDVRWAAIESRDATMSGCFVYAVSTTGIYCRPGCGSRRPLREHVHYFSTARDAQLAGYRTCKRCRPDQAEVVDSMTKAVIATCREIEQTQGECNVAALAAAVGYSEGHLRRSFRDLVGVSLASYMREHQLARVRETLRDADSVTEAIFEAGYHSASVFYQRGAPRLGMTAAQYRDGARDEVIRYTTVETPVGVVLAASTERGLCSIRVDQHEESLVKGLFDEFPHASIERDDDGLRDVAIVLASAVRGEGDVGVLPLDLQGTAFQIRVWESLRAIPVGETRTYSDVAQQIGSPRAVRAVASACAANAVALAIPCHRVIRRDGSLGGYRWGLHVKEALLIAERDRSEVSRER